VLLECIIRQPPSLACPQALCQSRSLTSAETRPTNTPALGSRNHLVSSPRSPGGTRSRISTTIFSPCFIHDRRIRAATFYGSLFRVPQ